MSRQRITILAGLAGLTALFLVAAAYAFYGSPFPDNSGSPKIFQLGESPQALRLTVYETGIVAISATELRATDLPFQNFSADSLRLTRDGEDVPFYLAGSGDDARLYFYATAITNTMEAPAVYWLSAGTGVAMRQKTAAPNGPIVSTGWQRRTWEENTTFLGQANGDDIWLGPLLFAPASLDIPLDNIESDGGPGQLLVHLWSNNESATNPDHHVQLQLNGSSLTDHYWDGIKQQTIMLDLPAGALQPGTNTLTINVPGDTGSAGEAIYVDWVHLDYDSNLNTSLGQLQFRSNQANLAVNTEDEHALVFDITDPLSPIILTDVEYNDNQLRFSSGDSGKERAYLALEPGQTMSARITLVPEWESLKTAGLGADYLVLVADAEGFDTALEPLLAHRRAQGLQVRSVPINQVYDEFAHGRQTPAAIRDFLAYTQEAWDPAPRFVLLVGDATYDIYDYTGGKNKNLIPTYLVYTEFAGYVASDTWFSIFDEERPAPSLAVGRFPVQNLEELEVMVAKTIAYESESGTNWINRALLVADDEPRFDIASDQLNESLVASGYQTQKLYMTENEDIRDAIISALNQGVGILNYVGHGGVAVWGDELVLRAEDASILVNGKRLPIFTTFTCLNGYFNHPSTDSLAETLLWAENGGVVAAIAPSGRSFTSQQTPLADAFYNYLLTAEASTLGEALEFAKIMASSDPDLREVIHTFNLLGDPALVFQLP